MSYEAIKRNFEHGLWNERMVGLAVEKGVITDEQYFEITGQSYPNSSSTFN